MNMSFFRKLLLPGIVVLGSMFALPASATSSYDGPWTVQVETNAGSCLPSASYMILVLDGMLSGPADVSGKISSEGSVRASIGGAYATGQMQGKSGSGK
jgi:hypothetical protein